MAVAAVRAKKLLLLLYQVPVPHGRAVPAAAAGASVVAECARIAIFGRRFCDRLNTLQWRIQMYGSYAPQKDLKR